MKHWLLTLALALAASCGSDGQGPAELEVALVDENGAAPAEFRAVLTSGDEPPTSFSCPGAESAQLSCSERGFVLHSPQGEAELTVKAPGYGFVSQSLPGGTGKVEIALQRLAPFEASEHFRSGIAHDDGERAFLDLAVSSETELGTAYSVKFYIDHLDGAPRVYLQNTRRYPLHFDFARFVLGFAGTRDEFARRTYHGEQRTGLAGTLVYYPELRYQSALRGEELRSPLALEFFPSDDLSPELALRAHRLLEERSLWLELAGEERRLTYVPAGSAQEGALAGARESFARQDALWSEHVELFAGVEQQVLNPGVAYGTLRVVEPEQLARAVLSSRDIVVLPRLPNDLPLVGGTITHELQTPLSHVNLAARARGTPNLSLKDAATDPRVAPYVDKLVRFEVFEGGFSLEETSLAEAEAYWRSLSREPLVPKADVEFVGLPDFDELHFLDSIRVGVKAANLAELHQLLGEQAPRGFAVPFSAYDSYMKSNQVTTERCQAARDDCEEEGRVASLCDRVRSRCEESVTQTDSFAGFVERLLLDDEVATESALREAGLDAVKYLVGHGEVEATFAAALDARVNELFGDAQVRLRSSTNAEDLPGFSGAGLYESVSARATGDRRASLRIREVWASVWLWRAFEERQFWNIDHRAVRMAVAVNPAIDDEAANGVLITKNLLEPGSEGHYVNVQLGEVEVTNPEGGAVPEVFAIVPGPDQTVQVERQSFSSLSPGQPLLSDEEIALLADAADRVQAHFAPLYELPSGELALDLEFKFYGPERRLLIKQARPYSTSTGRD
jgi:pyruvate, water dikinase